MNKIKVKNWLLNYAKKINKRSYDLEVKAGIKPKKSRLNYYISQVSVKIDDKNDRVIFRFDGGMYEYFGMYHRVEFPSLGEQFREDLSKFCKKNGLDWEYEDNVSLVVYKFEKLKKPTIKILKFITKFDGKWFHYRSGLINKADADSFIRILDKGDLYRIVPASNAMIKWQKNLPEKFRSKRLTTLLFYVRDKETPKYVKDYKRKPWMKV